MKAARDVCEFFDTFPKSEFDALSVISGIHGSGSSPQVRIALKELCASGYLQWRWKEGKYVPKKMYSLNLSTDKNSYQDALA